MLKQLGMIIAAVLISTAGHTQITVGARVGVGFPTLRRTIIDRSVRTANIVGFHGGASVAYFFISTPGLYVESGAQLALLGGASRSANRGHPHAGDYDSRLHLYALQVPLRLGYACPLDKISLFVSGGMQPSVGLWGTIRHPNGQEMHTSKICFNDNFNRFDVAVSFHTGVGFGRYPLFLGIYVDYGLIGIQANNGEGHIGNFGLSLVYLFKSPSVLKEAKSANARVKNAADPQ